MLVQKKIVPLQTILRFCAVARTRLWHENCKLSRKFEVRNMKVKFGVLVGCVLCALSVACLGFLSRFEKSKGSWTPEDVYMQLGGSSYSTVSSGASSSDGVLVSMRGMSRMSRRVSAPSFSHAPSAGMSSYSLSPIAGTASYNQSPNGGLHTTSSAQFHSFGGGGNTGVSNGAVQSSVGSAAGFGVSMQSTSAYAHAANSSSLAVGDVMSVTGNMVMTSSYQGISGVAGPRAVNGRRNAPGMGANLDEWVQGLIGNSEYWYYNIDGIDYFNENKLKSLYEELIANGELPEGMSWDDFLDWFKGQSDRYDFPIPSGVWFLCLLAMGYGFYIAYRRKQNVVNSKN